eukprot:SAG31_NODE_916_length_11047_cov_3.507033_8_plen_111_part_00
MCGTLQFQVFGVVVDKRVFFRIGYAQVGILFTALPILFGLRQDLMDEALTHDTVESNTTRLERHIELLHEQNEAQHQQLVAMQEQFSSLLGQIGYNRITKRSVRATVVYF